MSEYDAVIVGSGPNGLTAAVTLAAEGWKVLVLEAADTIGGGTRSLELTEPGFVHDVCSAIHPLGAASPALRGLPLEANGVTWVHPEVPLAHPLDDDRVALLHHSLDRTADGLGADAGAYRSLMQPIVRGGLPLVDTLLSPLSLPKAPLALARYGLVGLPSAQLIDRLRLRTDEAGGLTAGLAAHSFLPLDAPITSGFGLLLGALGHLVGWPLARGGSQAIADALVAMLRASGGEVRTGHRVTDLKGLPGARATLFDVSPRAFVQLAGGELPPRYRRRLERYRYGPGVFKIDWALDGPIPWRSPDCARAATVHLGGTFAEVAAAEKAVARGHHADRPFVLLAQPSLFDATRAPTGKHTAWAYCHVPNSSDVDMTEAIEAQVERFAPGFRDVVRARSVMDCRTMQEHNANLVGGDIGGGVADLRQFLARPTLSLHPWRTPIEGVYLCSASTPPGAGVHGMCGWHAAQQALRRS